MDVGTSLVVVALIVSAAYVYAPLARLHVSRRFHVALPAGVVTPTADAVSAPPVELPEGVVKICDRESEAWMRDEMHQNARRLYAVHGDWNVVVGELERI